MPAGWCHIYLSLEGYDLFANLARPFRHVILLKRPDPCGEGVDNLQLKSPARMICAAGDHSTPFWAQYPSVMRGVH